MRHWSQTEVYEDERKDGKPSPFSGERRLENLLPPYHRMLFYMTPGVVPDAGLQAGPCLEGERSFHRRKAASSEAMVRGRSIYLSVEVDEGKP